MLLKQLSHTQSRKTTSTFMLVTSTTILGFTTLLSQEGQPHLNKSVKHLPDEHQKVRTIDYYLNEQRDKAVNPEVLYIFPNQSGIHGWIGNVDKDSLSKPLTLSDGKRQHSIKLNPDGTFTWKRSSRTKQNLIITHGKNSKAVTLPKVQKEKPVAFFIVDRAVSRPNGKIHFTAFVRQTDIEGNYKFPENKEIEVEIVSKKRSIVATVLKLKPDARGKITGTYQFTSADPLDDYYIRCKNGIRGQAEIKLAEYRKAKVRLDIAPVKKNEKLEITFKTLDFMNKKVPAGKLKLTISVIRQPDTKPHYWQLNTTSQPHPPFEDAANANSTANQSRRNQYLQTPSQSLKWYQYSYYQQALELADQLFYPWASYRPHVYQTISKELEMGSNGEVSYSFDLDPRWCNDGKVEISASVIDDNNREQYSSTSISLRSKQATGLNLHLSHSEIVSGRSLKLSAASEKGHVTFIVFKLKQDYQVPNYSPYSTNRLTPYFYHSARSNISPHWNYNTPNFYPYYNNNHQIKKEYFDVLAGNKQGDNYTNTLRIKQPGAYLVQAIVKKGGIKHIQEQTLVVHPKQRNNAVFISLVNTAVGTGKPLLGKVSSSYQDATILLAIEDATGTRSLHPVKLKAGKADFEITLPKNISFAAAITAIYTNNGVTQHICRKRFHTEPKQQPIQINTAMKSKVAPGSEVEIDIDTNLNEEVDLVVSVYDQSLLGIAHHTPIDGRSLLYANTQVENSIGSKMVKQHLSGLTIRTLRYKLNATLKNKEKLSDIQQKQLLNLKKHIDSKVWHYHTLRELLSWTGVSIQSSWLPYLYYNTHHLPSPQWSLNLKDQDLDKPLFNLITEPSTSGSLPLLFTYHKGMIIVHNNTLPLLNSPIWNYQSPLGLSSFRDSRLFDSRADGSFSATANSSLSFLPVNEHFQLNHAAGIKAGAGNSTLIRRDFSDSAFFDGNIRTDKHGKAKLKFKLPDSLTTWQVVVTAVSKDLSIGHHTDTFKTFKPVMIWPMLPQSFTEGDRVKVFAKVHNLTDKEDEFEVSCVVSNGKIHGKTSQKIKLPANSNKSIYFDYEVGSAAKFDKTEILMTIKGAKGSDASLKVLSVNPCKAEQIITRSGFATGKHKISIPQGSVPTGSVLEVAIVPSMAADMVNSIGYLLEYPYGCVEQTMSRFLPVVKVAAMLKTHNINDKKLQRKVPQYAKAGIKRLLALQRQDGGWGWQGTSATHEMMTPYALYGLIEAQKSGFEIPNKNALNKGFIRLETFINSMGSKQAADRIYCMWVYQHHAPLNKKWWQWLEAQIEKTVSDKAIRQDLLSDYATALALEIAVKRKKSALAKKLADVLEHRVKGTPTTAYWTTAGFSRWGNDRFEVTAAVLKAMVNYNHKHPLTKRIINFFALNKRGNKWNSTKDTAMILFAMCEYLNKTNFNIDKKKSITEIQVNGKTYKITNLDWKQKTIRITDIPMIHLIDGKPTNTINISFNKSNKMHMFRAVYRYWKSGKSIAAVDEGISVTRSFQLIDQNGKFIKTLNSGDTIPRGSYIRSQLMANLPAHTNNFALAVNPKISGAEYVKTANISSTQHVLKEEKFDGVHWHHENTYGSISNSCVYRVELSGQFQIAPAFVELMYETATRGNSKSFHLNVK